MQHAIFGTKHLIIVAISAILIVALFLLSRKMKFSTVCRTMFYVGIASETIKILYYIIQNEAKYGGILPKTDLPFHLCSIQILFVAVVTFSQSEKWKRFLLSFMFPSCLLGGIAAILIATNSSLNGTWVITAQYFLYHIAIVILALHIGTNKELKLTVSDYFSCLKFLGILFFFSVHINSILYDGNSAINFMYVASPPQSGLPFLNEDHGWLVYIIHYACLVLLCVTLCYLKPIILAIRDRHQKRKHPLEAAAPQEPLEAVEKTPEELYK